MTKDTPDDQKPSFNLAAHNDRPAVLELTQRIMTFFEVLKEQTYLPEGKSLCWTAIPMKDSITLRIGLQDTETNAEWTFPRPLDIPPNETVIGTPKSANPTICQTLLALPKSAADIPAKQMAALQAMFIIPQDIPQPAEKILQNPDDVRARLREQRDDILSKLGIFRAPD